MKGVKDELHCSMTSKLDGLVPLEHSRELNSIGYKNQKVRLK